MPGLRRTILIAALASAAAFTASPISSSTKGSMQLNMGFFDDLKLVFSDEGKQARKELEEQERLEQERLQREMVERRRNPEMMEEYELNVQRRRDYMKQQKTKLETQQESFYMEDEK